MSVVVWNYYTFQNNLGIQHYFTKYLKESFGLSSKECSAMTYFPRNAFFGEVPPKILHILSERYHDICQAFFGQYSLFKYFRLTMGHSGMFS